MGDEDRSALEVKIVRKLASNNVVGNHKKQIDTVRRWGFASHNRGKVREVIEELARDPEAPVEKYGGRDAIRLTSIAAAKEFIVENGGEVPWGLRD